MQTREGNAIPNSQVFELSPQEINQFGKWKQQHPLAQPRTELTGVYNCHGMVFASRRTGIHDNVALGMILCDDKYELVNREDVLPGDIILYITPENGDIQHSGLVVSRPQPDQLYVPLVCSKWGKYCEVIHAASDCPYDFSHARYYRIRR